MLLTHNPVCLSCSNHSPYPPKATDWFISVLKVFREYSLLRNFFLFYPHTHFTQVRVWLCISHRLACTHRLRPSGGEKNKHTKKMHANCSLWNYRWIPADADCARWNLVICQRWSGESWCHAALISLINIDYKQKHGLESVYGYQNPPRSNRPGVVNLPTRIINTFNDAFRILNKPYKPIGYRLSKYR